MIAFMAVSSATYTYVKIVVVLMYFTKRGRIDTFAEGIQAS